MGPGDTLGVEATTGPFPELGGTGNVAGFRVK